MCGRFVVAYDPQTLVSGFSLSRIQPFGWRFEPRWNVTPQSEVPVVFETREGERVAEPMRWGLVPHWAKDMAIGNKLNNARSEGMADKPSFRQAVRKRRCIVPASGFYEWTVATGADSKTFKQPHYISPRQGPFLAMAGLFEAWRPPGAADDEPWLLSCCVITTAANSVMAPIHDRMPVLLPAEHWAAWLSRSQQDPAALAPLLQGMGEQALQTWPVGRAVSRAGNEGPELVTPLADPAPGAGSGS